MTESEIDSLLEKMEKDGFIKTWFDPDIGEFRYARTEKGKEYQKALARMLEPT